MAQNFFKKAIYGLEKNASKGLKFAQDEVFKTKDELVEILDQNGDDELDKSDITSLSFSPSTTNKFDFDIEDLIKKILSSKQEEHEKLTHLNLIVAGKTGVGKSTLINTFFGDYLAKTGLGKPVTTELKEYSKEGVPLSIYDTQGLELNDSVVDSISTDIKDLIREKYRTKDINQFIHFMLYCINTESSRIEDSEIKFIESLTESSKEFDMPVIVVLTKAYDEDEAQKLKQTIENLNLDIVDVMPVLAEKKKIGNTILEPYGLKELLKVIKTSLPEELKKTLIKVQQVSLDEKVEQCRKIVKEYVAIAAAECVVPIPIADALMLVPTQLAMIGVITERFGFDIDTNILVSIIFALISAGGSSIIGREIVGSILKLIPGVGAVVGTAVSTAVASAITFGIGEAIIQILLKIHKGELSTSSINSKESMELMKTIFKNAIKNSKVKE